MDYTETQDFRDSAYVTPGRKPPFLLILIICILAAPAARAEEVELRPDHPERYTVVKGDTLWDIAQRFLKSPWHWPKLWKLNERIKNPHLIYPGDVIVLRYVDGKPELTVLRNGKPEAAVADAKEAAPAQGARPTVKLSPTARVESLEKAIPTIPPQAIAPFLVQPLVVGEKELEQAGYITIGLDNRIALGNLSEFYARGVKDGGGQEFYQIFRQGNAIRNPHNPEDILGYEAIYLGDAKRLESGDPAKFIVTRARQEILPRDRLLPSAEKAVLPYYYPHAPKTRVEGQVLPALNTVAEMGPYTIVVVNLGRREGIEEGHVLRVMRHVGTHLDPETREPYRLPDEESALIMVFRTFDKVSYALVMSAMRPVHAQDTVVTP